MAQPDHGPGALSCWAVSRAPGSRSFLCAFSHWCEAHPLLCLRNCQEAKLAFSHIRNHLSSGQCCSDGLCLESQGGILSPPGPYGHCSLFPASRMPWGSLSAMEYWCFLPDVHFPPGKLALFCVDPRWCKHQSDGCLCKTALFVLWLL